MKKIFFLIVIITIIGGCRNNSTKLSFFQTMNQYAKFDSIENKSILLGFDKIILKVTNEKKENAPCYQLCTPDDGAFNIKGLIWLKDSVIHIKVPKADCYNLMEDQVLFNFKSKNSAWEVNYKIKEIPYYLAISKEGRYYNTQLKDSITVFRIAEGMKMASWSKEYYIYASLKYGFVGIAHWTLNHIYYIDFIPRQKVSIKELKPSLNKSK